MSVWFRGIFRFDPQPELMAEAPFGFQLHAMLAMLLFALWPFTRLVHVFSAPIGYLSRPYVVYRSREPRIGSRAPQRGWSRWAAATAPGRSHLRYGTRPSRGRARHRRAVGLLIVGQPRPSATVSRTAESSTAVRPCRSGGMTSRSPAAASAL